MLGFMCCVCMLALWLKSIPITFFGWWFEVHSAFHSGIYIGPWTIFELISWGLAPVYRPVCGWMVHQLWVKWWTSKLSWSWLLLWLSSSSSSSCFFCCCSCSCSCSCWATPIIWLNWTFKFSLWYHHLIPCCAYLLDQIPLGCRAFHDSRSWMDWCTDRWAPSRMAP